VSYAIAYIDYCIALV